MPPTAPRATLITTACHLSREHLLPVALHLAESPEELQLLATGRGPLRDMLEHLDAWYPSAFSPAAVRAITWSCSPRRTAAW